MQVTSSSKLRYRLQNLLFVTLFLAVIGLLGWLSTRYVYEADWTAGGRNTLTADSRRLLGELQGPVIITAFARDDPTLRERITDLVARYQRFKPDITLHFVNPDAEPDEVRKLGISVDGELVVAYHGRSEQVQVATERNLTNALLQTARQGQRWIVFLSGHGERDPASAANFGLGDFGKALERKGLKVRSLTLADTPKIPADTSVLVIASPQVKLLPGEVKLVRAYVKKGGDLLWMAEPGSLEGLDPLAEDLGVDFLPGTVVDPTSQLFGINNPAFILITDYPSQPVTRDLQAMTLFPTSAALETKPDSDWQSQSLLTTAARAWTETGPLAGTLRYDPGTDERPGPLDLAFALTRSPNPAAEGGQTPRQQRVIVMGDGDFLSNAYIGNGANLDLGLNMIHWLSHDDAFMDIAPKEAPDRSLQLTRMAQGTIGLGFLVLLPAGLILTGVTIWLRRRKR